MSHGRYARAVIYDGRRSEATTWEKTYRIGWHSLKNFESSGRTRSGANSKKIQYRRRHRLSYNSGYGNLRWSTPTNCIRWELESGKNGTRGRRNEILRMGGGDQQATPSILFIPYLDEKKELTFEVGSKQTFPMKFRHCNRFYSRYTTSNNYIELSANKS